MQLTGSTRSLHSATWTMGLAAVALALSAAELIYRLSSGDQQYDQFTVGSITWRAAAKAGDYLLAATFVVTAVVAFVSLKLLAQRIEARSGPSAADVLSTMLGFCGLPLLAWSGAAIVSSGAPFHLVRLSGIAVLAAAILATWLHSRARTADAVSDWLPVSLVNVLLGALFVPALAFALNRVRMLAGHDPLWWGTPSFFVLAGVGALGGGVVSVVLAHGLRRDLARTVIALLQLPLPWLYLVFVPLPWIEGAHVAASVPVGLLPIAALVFVTLAYLDLIWRWFARVPASAWVSVVSPVCLAAVVLTFRLVIPPAAGVSADDYHFGEVILPWWSWTEGLLPYRDFVPARGLVNYLDGACADLLGDGTASFVASCGPVVLGSSLVAAIAAASTLVGPLAAAAMFSFLPLIDELTVIDLVLTTFLIVGWRTFDTAAAVRWLSGWAVAALLAFLFAPGQGALAIIASAPLALWQGARALLDDGRRLRLALLVGAGVAMALVLLTPLGAMLLGAFRYVTEHGAVASAAHGVEWKLSVGSQPRYWAWEAFRSAFTIVPVVAGVVLGNVLLARDWERVRRIALFALPVLVLGLLYIPRAAGRIGPGEPSRLGLATIWMFSALVPLVLHAAWSARRWHVILGITTFVVAAVSSMYGFIDLRIFEARAIPAMGVPATLVDGARYGLPRLGLADVAAEHLARLTSLRRILDTLLDPGETYLDMTNRNGHYFYFERRPPIESGALYNLPNDVQQLRAIARLRAEPVPVVLAYADSILHDGGPVSLRNHALYRYFVQRLTPVRIDRAVFLVQADRLPRLGSLSGVTVRTGDPVFALEQAFPSLPLERLPAAWGRSWDTLRASALPVMTLPAAPAGKWSFESAPLDGRAAGLLVLSLECRSDAARPVTMTVRWRGEAGRGQLTFTADPLVVVPLDATPRWLMANEIVELTLESSDPTACNSTSVTRAELWQRKIAALVDPE
jgi:hypothetical protein